MSTSELKRYNVMKRLYLASNQVLRPAKRKILVIQCVFTYASIWTLFSASKYVATIALKNEVTPSTASVVPYCLSKCFCAVVTL